MKLMIESMLSGVETQITIIVNNKINLYKLVEQIAKIYSWAVHTVSSDAYKYKMDDSLIVSHLPSLF